MGYAWWNVASLLLGVAALLLGMAALALAAAALWVKKPAEKSRLPAAWSFLCCALALLGQVRYGYHLVQIEDWSALLDTAHAVWLACAGLTAAVTALNALALALGGRGK